MQLTKCGKITLTIIVACLLLLNSHALPLPINQYAYVLARNQLSSIDEHYDKLSYKENMVSLFMESMKRREFDATSKYFYPSRPIESELEKIVVRDLYKLLFKLPKGGNLHM